MASAVLSQAQRRPPAPGAGEGLGALCHPALSAGTEEGLRGHPGNSLGSPPLDSRLSGYSQGRCAAAALGPPRDWPLRPCLSWSGAPAGSQEALLQAARQHSACTAAAASALCSWGGEGPGWGVDMQRACGQCVWGSVCLCARAVCLGQCVCAVCLGQCVWGRVCVCSVSGAVCVSVRAVSGALLGASGSACCSSVTRLCPLTVASAPQEPSLQGPLACALGPHFLPSPLSSRVTGDPLPHPQALLSPPQA